MRSRKSERSRRTRKKSRSKERSRREKGREVEEEVEEVEEEEEVVEGRVSVIAPISSNLQWGDMFYRVVLHHYTPRGWEGRVGGARPEIKAPPPPLLSPNPWLQLHPQDSKTVTH